MMVALDWLVTHGAILALGSTVLLGIGCLAVAAHRQPLHTQRIGELTLLAALLWVCTATLPLPRWDLPGLGQGSAAASVTTPLTTSISMGRTVDAERDDSLQSELTPALPLAAVSTHNSLSSNTPTRATAQLELSPRTQATPEPPAPAGLDLGEIAAGLFLTGSLCSLAWLALGWMRLRAILRAARPAPAHVCSAAPDASRRAGHPRARLLVSDQLVGPFCVGAWRPVIVLPSGLCLPQNSSLLQHVVAHELAHARQGDGRGRLLAALTLPVFWCHPLYWWLRQRARMDAELVADECAAAGTDRTTYARQLVTLAESALAAGPVPAGAHTILGRPSEFSRRIEMLLTRHQSIATSCTPLRQGAQGLFAVVLALGTSAFFGVTPLQAQDAQSARDNELLAARNQQMAVELDVMRAIIDSLQEELSAVHDLRQDQESDSNTTTALGRLTQLGYIQAKSQEPGTLGQLLGDISGVLSSSVTKAPEPGAHTSALDPALFSIIGRLFDIQSEIELSERELSDTAALAEEGFVSSAELHRAKSSLHNQMRKRDVLRTMISGELSATERELDGLVKASGGAISAPHTAAQLRLETRLSVLRSAL